MIQPLDWDSRFLGLSIGKLQLKSPLADACATAQLAGEMESSGVELVYIFSSGRQPLLESLGFELLDGKMTFRKPIKGSQRDLGDETPGVDVRQYEGPATEQLLQLAIQSGHYSRFRRDPRLEIHYTRLYREWMVNSLNRRFAEDVFVAIADDQIGGIVTVRKHDGFGQIGLIAVDHRLQGRRLGSRLLDRAEVWYAENGLSRAEVITQQFNIGACRFYQRHGYQQASIVYVYHVWADVLRQSLRETETRGKLRRVALP